jgi:hypothetical protein
VPWVRKLSYGVTIRRKPGEDENDLALKLSQWPRIPGRADIPSKNTCGMATQKTDHDRPPLCRHGTAFWFWVWLVGWLPEVEVSALVASVRQAPGWPSVNGTRRTAS